MGECGLKRAAVAQALHRLVELDIASWLDPGEKPSFYPRLRDNVPNLCRRKISARTGLYRLVIDYPIAPALLHRGKVTAWEIVDPVRLVVIDRIRPMQ